MVGFRNARNLCAFALLALATLGTGCQKRTRMLPHEVMPMRQAERGGTPTEGAAKPEHHAERPSAKLEGAVSVRHPAATTGTSAATVDG